MEMDLSSLAEKVSKSSRRCLTDGRHRPSEGECQGISKSLEVIDVAFDFVVDTNMMCGDRRALESFVTDYVPVVDILLDDISIDNDTWHRIASGVECRASVTFRLVEPYDVPLLCDENQNIRQCLFGRPVHSSACFFDQWQFCAENLV